MRKVGQRTEYKERAGEKRKRYTSPQLTLSGSLLTDNGINIGDDVEVVPIRDGEISVRRVGPRRKPAK